MRTSTLRGGSDLGFSLGATIATLTLATALTVFAGPKVASAIKRKIAEADASAQSMASSIGGIFDRLPALQDFPAESPAQNASERALSEQAPYIEFPASFDPPPFIMEPWRPGFHGHLGRPLYQPYWQPFPLLPQEEFLPAWPVPGRKRHRRLRPRTILRPDRRQE
jgi:hypothetical protein